MVVVASWVELAPWSGVAVVLVDGGACKELVKGDAFDCAAR